MILLLLKIEKSRNQMKDCKSVVKDAFFSRVQSKRFILSTPSVTQLYASCDILVAYFSGIGTRRLHAKAREAYDYNYS